MFNLQFTTNPITINNTNNVVRVTSRTQQLQQQLEQQLLSSNTTSSTTNASSLSSYNNTINSHNRSSSQYTVNNNNANETTITPNHNHTMNSVNNCFPKSYTEYYQQQQLQQQQQHQLQQHHNNSADYPYTVERTGHPNPNNPFLATNFKKFHTNTNSMTCSMNRKNSKSEDKKFYSLKFSAKKNGGLLLKQSMGKCKRHHSFADGGLPPSNDTKAMKMHFYEPPVYENLTDSIQILECNVEPSVLTAAAAASATAQHHQVHLKKKHGAAQQQQHHTHRHNRPRALEDSNIILEPEKLSIYRSDSGISNSSFECITTPVPAPRQGEPLMQLPQHNNSSKSSTIKAHSNPVYMNISSGGSSTSSPSNHVHTSSPSDPSIAADPISSCTSTCNKHYKCMANNSNNCKEIIVHQQQQIPPSTSSSGLLSAGASANTSSNSNRKCKRRVPSSCSTLVNVEVC